MLSLSLYKCAGIQHLESASTHLCKCPWNTTTGVLFNVKLKIKHSLVSMCYGGESATTREWLQNS